MSVTLKWNVPPEQLTARLRRNVVAAMTASGEDLKTEIVESILEGAILNEGHIASKPGEAPNADKSGLHPSYTTAGAWKGDAYEQTTGSHLDYARHLEEGTARMEPRPHVAPAEAKLRAAHLDRLASAMKAAFGG